jgi:hypothetical protein
VKLVIDQAKQEVPHIIINKWFKEKFHQKDQLHKVIVHTKDSQQKLIKVGLPKCLEHLQEKLFKEQQLAKILND